MTDFPSKFAPGNPYGVDSDIYINPAYDNDDTTFGLQKGPGYKSYLLMLHEVGHALGFGHPGIGSLASYPLPASPITTAHTLMKQPGIDPKPGGGEYTTWRPWDKAALAWLYGCPLWGCGAADPYDW